MVIDKGKVIDISPFSFKGEIILSIHANPVRFLGRTIDFTVSDKHSVERFVTEVLPGLELIDKSSHKGIDKPFLANVQNFPGPISLISLVSIAKQFFSLEFEILK